MVVSVLAPEFVSSNCARFFRIVSMLDPPATSGSAEGSRQTLRCGAQSPGKSCFSNSLNYRLPADTKLKRFSLHIFCRNSQNKTALSGFLWWVMHQELDAYSLVDKSTEKNTAVFPAGCQGKTNFALCAKNCLLVHLCLLHKEQHSGVRTPLWRKRENAPWKCP